MDGFEACRRLRADPDTADATIVMLTAAAGDAAEREAEEAGADLFLTKPFSPLELLRLVDEPRPAEAVRGLPGPGLERGRPAGGPARGAASALERRAWRSVAPLVGVRDRAPGRGARSAGLPQRVPGGRDGAGAGGAARGLQAGGARAGPRARGPRHGPRPIDVDLLLLGGLERQLRAPRRFPTRRSPRAGSCSSRCSSSTRAWGSRTGPRWRRSWRACATSGSLA